MIGFQGSIFGHFLFAVYVSLLFDIKPFVTFVDDNHNANQLSQINYRTIKKKDTIDIILTEK